MLIFGLKIHLVKLSIELDIQYVFEFLCYFFLSLTQYCVNGLISSYNRKSYFLFRKSKTKIKKKEHKKVQTPKFDDS